jgi:hypothetical protein
MKQSPTSEVDICLAIQRCWQNFIEIGVSFLSYGSTALYGPGPPRFVEVSWSHILRHTTVGRTPLDEGPARRRDLYLTTHNTHNRQTSMSPVGFEPTILVSERPKTHALDRTVTAIGWGVITFPKTARQ